MPPILTPEDVVRRIAAECACERDIPVDRVAGRRNVATKHGHEKMAQDNRPDLARLERMERRLQALEDAEAIRNLKALCRLV